MTSICVPNIISHKGMFPVLYELRLAYFEACGR